ncbi:GntR family transcriptional regulator [Devosia algicola]|uniref:GntR family transcriptional regulator n=1 Tax=Devosia algicola TaxID=3026418 RepID=A0ABY7YNL5_9HYPH|nr:GntR family transcriptional regulator [Devosia algicola]WDR02883.1 GntR family transcriptional regulator [Devosia algicola]
MKATGMGALSDVPKYEQAYRVILDRLKAGRYPIGGRMPTEGELSEHFKVSRVTIRRALDMLVQDGYVESRQGSGYRVITLSPASDTCLTSFTDAMLRAGLEPTSQLLSLVTFEAGNAALAHLPADMQARAITRVNRLRLVDGKPRMLVMSHAPAELLQGATAADFPESGPAQSILRILAQRFKLEWSAACEDISPVVADAEMAGLFGIDAGSPILRQACSAFDDDGSTVFHEDVFRTGAVSFTLSKQHRQPNHLP